MASTDVQLVDWVRRAASRSRRITSVCSGAFVLAAAGVLDGRRATTHWDACDRLARAYPDVTVDPDPIFVEDGNVWTSAGVTAGMDLALALGRSRSRPRGRAAHRAPPRALRAAIGRAGAVQRAARRAARRARSAPRAAALDRRTSRRRLPGRAARVARRDEPAPLRPRVPRTGRLSTRRLRGASARRSGQKAAGDDRVVGRRHRARRRLRHRGDDAPRVRTPCRRVTQRVSRPLPSRGVCTPRTSRTA